MVGGRLLPAVRRKRGARTVFTQLAVARRWRRPTLTSNGITAAKTYQKVPAGKMPDCTFEMYIPLDSNMILGGWLKWGPTWVLGPDQEAWVWEAGGSGDREFCAGKVAGEGLRHGDGKKQELDAGSKE